MKSPEGLSLRGLMFAGAAVAGGTALATVAPAAVKVSWVIHPKAGHDPDGGGGLTGRTGQFFSLFSQGT